jgi:hypothetical protein
VNRDLGSLDDSLHLDRAIQEIVDLQCVLIDDYVSTQDMNTVLLPSTYMQLLLHSMFDQKYSLDFCNEGFIQCFQLYKEMLEDLDKKSSSKSV